jgi:hypothetical protein
VTKFEIETTIAKTLSRPHVANSSMFALECLVYREANWALPLAQDWEIFDGQLLQLLFSTRPIQARYGFLR